MVIDLILRDWYPKNTAVVWRSFTTVTRRGDRLSRSKMPIVWVVKLCNLVEVYRRFRGACSHHYRGYYRQTTRRNNPEDSRLYNRRRENLKSQDYRDRSSTVPRGINQLKNRTVQIFVLRFIITLTPTAIHL
jgi:hypothetical protein